MDSLAASGRDYALRQVALISAARGKGYSEDEVAETTGYRGAGHMRQELERWEMPTWFVEGDAPPEPKAGKSAQPKRRARGAGPVKGLPPASNAAPLFRERLEALAQGNEDLRHRKEEWQGGLFHQSAVYTDPVYFPRDQLPDELWKSLCEAYELDPEEDNFLDTNAKTWSLGGGTPAPQAPLPALIAAYVLMDGELAPLLDALHPEPSEETLEQVRKLVEDKKDTDKRDGLKVIANQLAKLVRGGEVRPGRDPADLSNHEYNLACRITDDRDAGIPDREIFQKWREKLSPELELTWKEFCRLRDLNRRWVFRQ